MSNNCFTELPKVLGACPNLEMVCGLNPTKSQPLMKLRYRKNYVGLILTDNKITQLPDSLGLRPRLPKLALARKPAYRTTGNHASD
ncbi:hypothetical protein [Photobacterium leiognathi]|uniref:hypothetical protein n=1 Tax=Photobacterium leiognathi TaxID=553611 RepID=UPI00273A00E1|nr:hypothetical protein [Photobacterium leiognathi]